MTVDKLFALLARASGGSIEQSGESGILTIPGRPPVAALTEAGLVHLRADLAALSRNECARCALKLLSANLYGVLPGGSASFAYDAGEEKLVLWDKLDPKTTSAVGAQKRLAAFQATAAHWIKRIENG